MKLETISTAFNTLVVMFVAGAFIAGCSSEPRSSGGEVEAIYWHEGQRYTAVTENAGLISHHNIPPWGHAVSGAISLYKDLGADEKAWYKCEWDWNAWNGADHDTAYCEIHIHSLDELGTGNWNHGKFGSGTTSRIE